MAKILIVDDDQRLLRMLQRTLVYEGFEAITASDGQEALDRVFTERPDLLVLDWMLPKVDGVQVLEALRAGQNQVPVLMLTARDAVHDRVEGLEQGADDYLVKPFASAELVARIRALLRRAGEATQTPLTFADLYIDPVTREMRRGERHFDLTPTEYSLLRLFLRNPHRVLERRQILTEVWGYDFFGDDNVIEVYVGYLRRKLEAEGETRLIQTLRGVGYVLREEA